MHQGMTAVAALWDSGAVVLNGYTTAITVASAMIQAKNICGRGVAIRSRCMMAVAASAAPPAAIAYPAVDASPHAPSWRGARTGVLSSHRHTRMPASAISAATAAVAAPPDHSCLASTVRPGELLRSEGGSSGLDMGVVIGSPYVDPLIAPGHTTMLSRLIPASRATRAARAARPASNHTRPAHIPPALLWVPCPRREVRRAPIGPGLAVRPAGGLAGDATQSATPTDLAATPGDSGGYEEDGEEKDTMTRAGHTLITVAPACHQPR